MKYYPIFLDIKGRSCLVVGGGDVGTRKVEMLLDCGASVTVVSINVSDTLNRLSEDKRILLIKRAYRPSDLDGRFLLIGATNDEDLNQQLSLDAEKRNLLCNIADRPEACSFILPAIIRRGDLVLAVSTSGKSPALAKKLRKELERQFGEAYAVLLDLMGAVRKRLLTQKHAPEEHKPFFQKIIYSDIISWIQNRQFEKINDLLFDILGPGYTLEDLLTPDFSHNETKGKT